MPAPGAFTPIERHFSESSSFLGVANVLCDGWVDGWMDVQNSDPGHPANVHLAGQVTVTVFFHFLHDFGTEPHSSLEAASQLPVSESCPTCTTEEMMIILFYPSCPSLGLSFQAWQAPVPSTCGLSSFS